MAIATFLLFFFASYSILDFRLSMTLLGVSALLFKITLFILTLTHAKGNRITQGNYEKLFLGGFPQREVSSSACPSLWPLAELAFHRWGLVPRWERAAARVLGPLTPGPRRCVTLTSLGCWCFSHEMKDLPADGSQKQAWAAVARMAAI